MNRKSVTLKDIASEFGVSLMTVSRAINGTGGISPELRSKILDRAAELRYRPSHSVAAFSAQKSTRTVGLVLPHLANTIFPAMVDSISEALSETGYRLLLACTEHSEIREFQEISALLERNVDGIVWAPVSATEPTSILNMLAARKCPVVFVDRAYPSSEKFKADAVLVNDRDGMRGLVGHLVSTGRRRIAYLDASVRSHVSVERLAGYREAMESAGLAFDRTLVVSAGSDVASGRKAASALLKSRGKFDAIACFNDPLSVGAHMALRDCGVRIPDDVALTGFSGTIETELTTPQITTAIQDAALIGREAAFLLLSRFRNAGLRRFVPTTRIIPVRIVLRDSSSAPRRRSPASRATAK